MRTLYICLLFILLVLKTSFSFAQEKDVCVEFNIDYTITMSQNRVVGTANLMIQDMMYAVSSNDVYVCSDGESVWTLDMLAKEAYAEPVSEDMNELIDIDVLRAELENMKTSGSGRFELSDGNIVEVKVNSFSESQKKSVTSFRPQIEFGPEWVVTDLR